MFEKTEYLNMCYDINRLSEEEVSDLEFFCKRLYIRLINQIEKMGLTLVDGGSGQYITKFTQEELNEMESVTEIGNATFI